MLASSNGHTEIVNFLLNTSANINAKCNYGNDTSLSLAARKGHVAIVKYLLENGADINFRNSSGITAMDLAKCHDKYEVVKVLEEWEQKK